MAESLQLLIDFSGRPTAPRKGIQCQIRNGDTPRSALPPGVLTTRLRAIHYLNAPTATKRKCRTALAPNAATIKDAKSSTLKRPA